MKIYNAAVASSGLKIAKRILLSFYDITMSPIPFRKETWLILTKPQEERNEK